MSLRRMQVKLSRNIGRNPIKKCTFWKVISFLFAGIFVWSVFVLMTASEHRYRLQETITNITYRSTKKIEITGMLNSTERSEITGMLNSTERSEIPEAYSYEELIQENPLGVYFSERMGGKLPTGSAHLEHVKIKQNKFVKMVLIFVQNATDPSVEIVGAFFARQRIQYRFRSISKIIPILVLEDMGVARYSLIVFHEYTTYLKMDPKQRAVIDSYCRKYKVGILAMVQSVGNENVEVFRREQLKIIPRVQLKKYKLNPEVDFWRIGKVNEIYLDTLPSSDWTIFIGEHKTYIPLVFSSLANQLRVLKDDATMTDLDCIPAIHDQGLRDGIQRVIFGYRLDFWLNTIVATDAISFLTGSLFALPMTRLLQVDIDDIFVGSVGVRTLEKDAKAMVASQEKIGKLVPGFKYNLGFSGEFFMKGNEAEQVGDRALVELASHFVWFDHLSRHNHVLFVNRTGIQMAMDKNVQFAKDHKIEMTRDYMVPPYHAGIYPVYEPLYDEWNNRHIAYSSTTEYPKESPVWGRRGFIYRDVMVLPRVECSLYTSVNRFSDFVGGKEGLDRSIRGELLFKLFLHTPILIFMTHMSNYANDQLGEYTFESEIEFVTKWTNLKVTTATPNQVARTYFQMYPRETVPIWTNPCVYNSKHFEILPPHVICSRFPKFFILGTRQSDMTVLTELLETHPMMFGARTKFEGTVDAQFFSGTAYLKGLDWYQNQFPEHTSEGSFLFEGSHHYLHDKESPRRVSALVPKAKIVIVLEEPIMGAFCCYQNLLLHLGLRNVTFYQAVGQNYTSFTTSAEIRSKCLKPMTHAINLARWLGYFDEDQILVVDDDQIRQDPVAVLNQIETFLAVVPYIDFSTTIRHDPKSNSFCRSDGRCLRVFGQQTCPGMDDQSKRFLQDYFHYHNSNLRILLNYLKQRYPRWLLDTYPH